MRGADLHLIGLFSYVSSESRFPKRHLLRPIRDTALVALSDEFEASYAKTHRPSISPENLIKALLLQVFYSIRSGRQ